MQRLLKWRSDTSDMPHVRYRGPLIVPFARTKYKQHSFNFFAPKLLNEMKTIDLNVSISTFKRQIALLTSIPET